jgi:hypothetical protein
MTNRQEVIPKEGGGFKRNNVEYDVWYPGSWGKPKRSPVSILYILI